MEPATATEFELRAQRGRRVRLAIVTSLATRPLAVLIPLLVVPLFVRYLGAERYGLYEAVGSLAVWVALGNVGLGYGLHNRLIDAHVADDRRASRILVSTMTFTMMVVCIAGLVVSSTVTWLVDWCALLNAPRSVESELRMSVWLAFTIGTIALSLNTAPNVYSAFQEHHRRNAWDALGKVATIGACLALPFTSMGLPGAMLAIAGAATVVNLVNHVWLFCVEKPWVSPSARLFDWRSLRAMFRDGILLFALQTSSIILFQCDRFVIGVLRSPEEVAEYGVLIRVMMLVYGVYLLVLSPLWAAYGEAFRRGDIEWCRRVLRFTSLAGVLIMLGGGIAVILARQAVFSYLSGGAVMPPLAAIAGLTVSACVRTWCDAHSILLNGASVLRPQITPALVNSVLAIAISIPATIYFGVVGTAWSYAISTVLTSAWWAPLLVRRHVFTQGNST